MILIFNALLYSTESNASTYYSIENKSYQSETGKISVNSSPEQGMMIFLNDQSTGKVTPAVLENIPEGVHTIKLTNSWFRSQEKTVTVTRGQQTEVFFDMVPAFAELTVNTSTDAIIYIDGSIKGTTTWKGRVSEGVRNVKVVKEGFVTREHQVTIVRGRDISIDLMLTAKKGTLDIKTDPPQAMISLDGKMYGLSPRIITDLPFGNYTLSLEKPDHTSVVMRVSITDTNPIEINVPLLSGKEITLLSNPSGASITINDEHKGETPLKIWLKYGSYNIKFDKDGKTVVENIVVSHGGVIEFTANLKTFTDPFEGQMVFVKGGGFRMGDTYGDGNREEKPVHPVTLNDFYIGKYEVTQAQWKEIMGENPSHFAGCDDCPVERISWLDVQEFLTKLNELTGKNYRLPSEAEWEYAAKGGENSRGFRYAGKNNINFVSWYSGNSGNKTQPVGQKEPNELGLYDMSGNVWEWVNDWFDFYTDSPKVNPKGPENGDFRIVKGGSWFGYIGGSRVSCRGSDDPSNKRSYIGFRIARSVETEPTIVPVE